MSNTNTTDAAEALDLMRTTVATHIAAARESVERLTKTAQRRKAENAIQQLGWIAKELETYDISRPRAVSDLKKMAIEVRVLAGSFMSPADINAVEAYHAAVARRTVVRELLTKDQENAELAAEFDALGAKVAPGRFITWAQLRDMRAMGLKSSAELSR